MAYQNVGTPRFYIDIPQFVQQTGLSPITKPYVNLNPGQQYTVIAYDPAVSDGLNDTRVLDDIAAPLNQLIGENGYVAFLGHNFKSCDVEILIQEGTNDYQGISRDDADSQVNYGTGTHCNPDYDGFSIATCSFANFDQTGGSSARTIQLRFESGVYGENDLPTPYNGLDVQLSSFSFGVTYTMPHSPDLSLTMTREMNGVKRIRTKGGADLVNHKYIKPAMWGDAGAWELYEGTSNHALSRSGRRVWDLSFSYLQDSDVFAPTHTQNVEIFDTLDGGYNVTTDYFYSTTIDANVWNQNKRFLAHDDFYTQVIHKTNGGQLPFIFQPDGSNNNPDGFAICKFDMKEFKFEQVANGVYNMKLKIREVW